MRLPHSFSFADFDMISWQLVHAHVLNRVPDLNQYTEYVDANKLSN